MSEDGSVNPLRNPFAGGRQSLEQPGLGATPQELHRERNAKLTIQLADLTYFSDGPLGQRLEGIRFQVPIVAARIGVARLRCSSGFYLHEVRVANANPTMYLATPAVETALVTGAATVVRTFQAGPIAELVAVAGDAATGGSGWYLPANAVFAPPRPVWFAPNAIVEFLAATLAAAIDIEVLIQSPTLVAP